MKTRFVTRLLTLCVGTALAGCGGAGAIGGGNNGAGCSPTTYSITYPTSANGYSASGSISSATNCFSSAQVQSFASAGPTIGSAFQPPAGATTLVYFGVTFSTTEYATGLPAMTITLPSSLSTTGHSFYLAHNGSQGAALGWTAAVAGPVSASGSTVTFPTSNGNTTFYANMEDELALYMI